jgi:hypothetical protein
MNILVNMNAICKKFASYLETSNWKQRDSILYILEFGVPHKGWAYEATDCLGAGCFELGA